MTADLKTLGPREIELSNELVYILLSEEPERKARVRNAYRTTDFYARMFTELEQMFDVQATRRSEHDGVIVTFKSAEEAAIFKLQWL